MKFQKVLTLSCCLALAACGSSSSGGGGGDDSAAISDVGSLPKATSPVVGADGSLSSLPKAAKPVSKLALGDYSNDAFDGSESRAACEAGNVLKEAVSAAAKGDLILCYVQNVMQQNIDSGNLSDNEIDAYDGEFHIYALDFAEGEEGGGGPSKVRMRITKDADGNITDFVMQACEDGGDAEEQSEYLHQAIDGNSFTMTSKGLHSDENFSSSHQVEVTGTLNSSGQFTDKEIAISSTWSSADEEDQGGNSIGTVTQDASTFSFSGSQSGAHGGGGYVNQVHFQAAVDDTNEDLDDYDIGLLGYGEGAVNALFTGTFDSDDDGNFGEDESETYSDQVGESWDNDLNVTDSNDLSEAVAAAELPDAITDDAVSFSFEDDEVYDCSGDAEAVLTVDQGALDTECSDLSLGHNWTNCHSLFD